MKSFRKSEVAKCVDSPPFFNCYFSRNRVKMQSVQKSAIDKQFSWKRDDVTRGEERQDGKFMIDDHWSSNAKNGRRTKITHAREGLPRQELRRVHWLWSSGLRTGRGSWSAAWWWFRCWFYWFCWNCCWWWWWFWQWVPMTMELHYVVRFPNCQ